MEWAGGSIPLASAMEMFNLIVIIGFALMIASQCAVIVELRRLRKSAPGARAVLPLSNNEKIKPGQSAEITARPQMFAIRPERLFVSESGTENGAADWIVNDIKVLGRSQFCQSGDIPGDMFSTKAIDSFVRLDMVERGLDFKLIVTYIGAKPEGCLFYGAVIGSDLDDREVPKQRKRDLKRMQRERRNAQVTAN